MNTSDFEQRLQRLETRVNRYRITTGVLGLCLIGLAGVAATAPSETVQELRAHKIVVVDEKGKEAAHLQAGPHGGYLTILNLEGRPVVRAGASDKGGRITLADAKGEQTFLQLTSDETGGEMLITDKKGQKSLMKATQK